MAIPKIFYIFRGWVTLLPRLFKAFFEILLFFLFILLSFQSSRLYALLQLVEQYRTSSLILLAMSRKGSVWEPLCNKKEHLLSLLGNQALFVLLLFLVLLCNKQARASSCTRTRLYCYSYVVTRSLILIPLWLVLLCVIPFSVVIKER
jgi:hypothetical protein